MNSHTNSARLTAEQAGAEVQRLTRFQVRVFPGAFSIGAQMCVVGVGATFYDTSVRATGVGWMLGTGRIGAILGPIFGGILLARAVPIPVLFVIAAAVSLAAALGVFLLERSGSKAAHLT